MSASPFHLRPAGLEDAPGFLRLVIALADFEKLNPPDAAAQAVGYAIFLETYSSFLALPSLYIEDVFVLLEHRQRGIGGALLKKAVELAHERGCGRVEWTALDWNVNARRVYEEKLGAQHMSEWCLYRMDAEAMGRYLEKCG